MERGVIPTATSIPQSASTKSLRIASPAAVPTPAAIAPRPTINVVNRIIGPGMTAYTILIDSGFFLSVILGNRGRKHSKNVRFNPLLLFDLSKVVY